MTAAGGGWPRCSSPTADLIEVLQGVTTYRTASLADALADALGVGLGLALARWSPAGFPPLTPAK